MADSNHPNPPVIGPLPAASSQQRSDQGHTAGPLPPHFSTASQSHLTAAAAQTAQQSQRSRPVSGRNPIGSESQVGHSALNSVAGSSDHLPPKLKLRMQQLMAELESDEPLSWESRGGAPSVTDAVVPPANAAPKTTKSRVSPPSTDLSGGAPTLKTNPSPPADAMIARPAAAVKVAPAQTGSVNSVTATSAAPTKQERSAVETNPVEPSLANQRELQQKQQEAQRLEQRQRAAVLQTQQEASRQAAAAEEHTARAADAAREADAVGESARLAQNRQQVEVTQATASFSQQAAEIVEVLRQRQIKLARHKQQLEQQQSALESQMRQQRMELVEKKRELLAETAKLRREQQSQTPPAIARQDQAFLPTMSQPQNSLPVPATANRPMANPSTANAVEPIDSAHRSDEPRHRRVTLASIARRSPGNPVAKDTPAQANVWSAFPLQVPADYSIEEAANENLDQDFLNALDQHFNQSERRQTPLASSFETRAEPARSTDLASTAIHNTLPLRPLSVPGRAERVETNLQQQAATLRQQHGAAIQSMRQTKRQLELLRNVISQQQIQWAERATDLADQHAQWNTVKTEQKQELQVDRHELDRLAAIQQNENSRRETSVLQREAAVRHLEEKLQEAQVEMLRDRVIVKQLERTARQTLSNVQWSERQQIIAQESDQYIENVRLRAEEFRGQTNAQMKRLDSRQAELLLHKESLRHWVERQMKLIARRSARIDEREALINERWADINTSRQTLEVQQRELNDMIRCGLEDIDARLDRMEAAPSTKDVA